MGSFAILSCALAYAVFAAGRTDASAPLVAVSLIALVSALRAAFTRRFAGPERLPASVRWPLALLVGYCCFQIVPLPLGALEALSPARAELLEAAKPAVGDLPGFMPLSLAPGPGFAHALRIGACALLLVAIAEIGSRHPRWIWFLIGPAVAVALAQAAIGFAQYSFGGGEARGSWANRNHFASFLAMCLPFPAMYAAAVLRRSRELRLRIDAATIACGWLCAAGALLAGIMFSGSRMGFVAALAGILAAGVAYVAAGRADPTGRAWKVPALAAMVATALAAFMLLAPPRLTGWLAGLDEAGGVQSEDRVSLWAESLGVVPAYPVFGTGLGGYESAFLKYKRTHQEVHDEYAHNDYVQFLVELGIAGFAIAFALAFGVIVQTIRALRRSDAERQALAAACLGAFAAVALHSTVDFNLYLLPNQLLLAWVAGIAVSPASATPHWKSDGAGLRQRQRESPLPIAESRV